MLVFKITHPRHEGLILACFTSNTRHAGMRKVRKIVASEKEKSYYPETGYRVRITKRVGKYTYLQRPRWQGRDPYAGWKTVPKLRREYKIIK